MNNNALPTDWHFESDNYGTSFWHDCPQGYNYLDNPEYDGIPVYSIVMGYRYVPYQDWNAADELETFTDIEYLSKHVCAFCGADFVSWYH